MESDKNWYRSEFVPISCNYPLREKKIIEAVSPSFVILNQILREQSTTVMIAVESYNICQTVKLRACFVNTLALTWTEVVGNTCKLLYEDNQ